MALTTDQIAALIQVPKYGGTLWPSQVIGSMWLTGSNYNGSTQLASFNCLGSSWSALAYARCSLRDVNDFSVGLIIESSSFGKYTLMRCNGPHWHPHTNHWPKRKVFVNYSHVHHLTARYLRMHIAQPKAYSPDHFATPCQRLVDTHDALSLLSRKLNIQSQGSLNI